MLGVEGGQVAKKGLDFRLQAIVTVVQASCASG